jgi:hypothetical protein
MRDIEPAIVSFHGADGCGKSTLARAFSTELEIAQGSRSVMIGGSSYLEWLTPDIANKTIGPNHHFAEVARTAEEKTRLYGQIAAVCYGYAGHLRNDKGVNVTIDSDPVLKRIIWNRLSASGVAKDSYEDRFGEYLLENVPETSFPTAVVGVNISGEVDPDDIQARLSKRGGNSEYDPSSIEETLRICEEVSGIWGELQRATLGRSGIKFFNDRFPSAQLISVTNADCSPAELEVNMINTSRQIIDSLR